MADEIGDVGSFYVRDLGLAHRRQDVGFQRDAVAANGGRLIPSLSHPTPAYSIVEERSLFKTAQNRVCFWFQPVRADRSPISHRVSASEAAVGGVGRPR